MAACGACTLCCTLCAVEDIGKKAGDACVHCLDGCDIYDVRPQGCRDFVCAYAQMAEVNIAMRPDNCGVVFEMISDKQVLGMVDPDRERYPHVENQIALFKKAGFEVVMTQEGETTWQ